MSHFSMIPAYAEILKFEVTCRCCGGQVDTFVQGEGPREDIHIHCINNGCPIQYVTLPYVAWATMDLSVWNAEQMPGWSLSPAGGLIFNKLSLRKAS